MSDRLNIELHAVSVRRGDTWALRDISLRLNAGERWALIGGNGAGKTQLLKLLGTDVWPTPTRRGTRTYSLGNRPVDLIAAKQRIAYIGAELQDKYALYGWNLPVLDLVASGLHRTDLLLRPVTREEWRRSAATLERCGLTHLGKRRFLSLSYGQKRLALLARALVQKPDWLLLDEFYNGLDADYRRRMDWIIGHARAAGQSWVASSHRAVDVPSGTRGVIELRAGRLRSVRPLNGVDLARLARRAGEVPPMRDARAARTVAGGRSERTVRGTGTAAKGALLLRIRGADLYVDYRAVLRDVNWDLHAGEHWAVFGANGSGKTSFLKLLYGDLSPALGGRLERAGFPRGTPIDSWKRRVGYISPELQTDYAVDVTVSDLVASGRHASIGLCDSPTPADRKSARRWLEYFALLSVAKRRPRELSYGQLRRALFARALAGDARILLLDEPLTGLDPRQRAGMKRLLERLMREGLTLIVAVHHPEDLPRGITHVLRLHMGRAYPAAFQSAKQVSEDARARQLIIQSAKQVSEDVRARQLIIHSAK
ncbi:MAG TPA: ATP-binding cassette domain-containing protein [Steroidobacteraceae bacterium]|nr:ATP-binding cassette domain-containing protein [Steroidobacteraceae bacterium]